MNISNTNNEKPGAAPRPDAATAVPEPDAKPANKDRAANGWLSKIEAFVVNHWKPLVVSLLTTLVAIVGYSNKHLYLSGFGINYGDYASAADLAFEALSGFGLLLMLAVAAVVAILIILLVIAVIFGAFRLVPVGISGLMVVWRGLRLRLLERSLRGAEARRGQLVAEQNSASINTSSRTPLTARVDQSARDIRQLEAARKVLQKEAERSRSRLHEAVGKFKSLCKWPLGRLHGIAVVAAVAMSLLFMGVVGCTLYARYDFSHAPLAEIQKCMWKQPSVPGKNNPLPEDNPTSDSATPAEANVPSGSSPGPEAGNAGDTSNDKPKDPIPDCNSLYRRQVLAGLLPVPQPVTNVAGHSALEEFRKALGAPLYYVGRHNEFLFFAYGKERLNSSVVVDGRDISLIAWGAGKHEPDGTEDDPPLPPPPPPPECDHEGACLAAQLAALQQGQATNAGAIEALGVTLRDMLGTEPPALPTSIQLDLQLPEDGIPIKFDDLAIKLDDSSTQGIQEVLAAALDHVRETLSLNNGFLLAMRKCDAMMPLVVIRGEHHRGKLVSCYEQIVSPSSAGKPGGTRVNAAVLPDDPPR